MESALPGLSPADEAARMDAVRRYDILDTPPDGAFDRITALAARLSDVPISTITIVDEDRIWFKSAVGLDGVSQIDREPGLCASAIVHPVPYIVTDASLDPRTLSNSLVCGELGLRFYLAVPLRTSDGHNLGTLNVIDSAPRAVREGEIENLEDLATVVVDELELRLAAKRAVELESLRAASEFRDTIVAGISHEMRTPVAVLQGIADLGLTDDISPEQADHVQAVFKRQVRHLGRLVEQFLDYAALEHGRAPTVQVVPTDIAALLGEIVELYADRGELTLEVRGDVPRGMVDPARTRQIVSELVANGLRFGPSDAPVALVLAAAGGEVTVSVIDQGPGVSESARDHVFEKDYRAPDSTGSGLGLFVARALAEAQGARITLDDGDAGGRFTLTVPAADEARG
ncbi:MAG: GAF domain-containing sensor histidine kinase [Nitriliruptor sp.]|uniref:GAF domain-containing sensor histidine kinase n=1 Tax=Nitriliruptor sp. TaxID=2448056 RepID=UPI0034A02374